MKKILTIQDLKVEFEIDKQKIFALRGVDFDLHEKGIIALVGESGSGKSCMVLSICRLLDPLARITNGKIIFQGKNILEKSQKEMQRIRGQKISITFQDPFSSLNPTMKIGKQILEAIDNKPTKQKVYDLLLDVGIQDPKLRYNQYPHQISGGMRQRVTIAIAIASNPNIIIADEPTTSLDTSYQMQIIDLLKKINRKYGSSIIFISHDLSLVANIASKIFIMYAGKIIEKGNTKDILMSPKHPYTKLLIDSIPKIDEPKKLPPIIGMGFSASKKSSLCLFNERCPYRRSICLKKYPESLVLENNQIVTCHLYKNSKYNNVFEKWKRKLSLSEI